PVHRAALDLAEPAQRRALDVRVHDAVRRATPLLAVLGRALERELPPDQLVERVERALAPEPRGRRDKLEMRRATEDRESLEGGARVAADAGEAATEQLGQRARRLDPREVGLAREAAARDEDPLLDQRHDELGGEEGVARRRLRHAPAELLVGRVQ